MLRIFKFYHSNSLAVFKHYQLQWSLEELGQLHSINSYQCLRHMTCCLLACHTLFYQPKLLLLKLHNIPVFFLTYSVDNIWEAAQRKTVLRPKVGDFPLLVAIDIKISVLYPTFIKLPIAKYLISLFLP